MIAMHALPVPNVVRSGNEGSMSILLLQWNPDIPGVADRTWELPEHVCITGPAPKRFAYAIDRRGQDSYQLKVLWNQMSLEWKNLTRRQLLTTALTPILKALGTDLGELLERPMPTSKHRSQKAA